MCQLSLPIIFAAHPQLLSAVTEESSAPVLFAAHSQKLPAVTVGLNFLSFSSLLFPLSCCASYHSWPLYAVTVTAKTSLSRLCGLPQPGKFNQQKQL
jgi:hypothetical protein